MSGAGLRASIESRPTIAVIQSGDPAPSPASSLTRFGDLSRKKAGEVLDGGSRSVSRSGGGRGFSSNQRLIVREEFEVTIAIEAPPSLSAASSSSAPASGWARSTP